MDNLKDNQELKAKCECGHDHDCDHDHDHDHLHEGLDVLHLTFDDDTEAECAVLGIFGVEDKEYIALLPEDEEQILLYEFQESEDDFALLPIEDEEELDLVYEAYQALFEDLEDEFDEYGQYDELEDDYED